MSGHESSPTADSGDAVFGLGWPQARLLAACLAVILATLTVVNATGFTYLVPRSFLRTTLRLYAYDTLQEPYDVVMVGSSRIDYSMDSRLVEAALSAELGEPTRVYKLTMHGLRPWLLYDVLRDFIRENPPRRLLVVGMGLQFFNNQAVDKANPLLQVGSLRDFGEVRISRLGANQWRALLTLPFRGIQVPWNLDWALSPEVLAMRNHLRLHGGELSPEQETRLTNQERFLFLRRTVTGGGRMDVLRGFDERLDIEPFEERLADVKYDMNEYWFWKVLDLLEEMPCDVMLIRTPVKPAFLDSITPETRAAFEREIVAEIRRRGFAYHNLNRPPYPRSDKEFMDVVHMGPEGRARTSELFAREILAPHLAAEARD